MTTVYVEYYFTLTSQISTTCYFRYKMDMFSKHLSNLMFPEHLSTLNLSILSSTSPPDEDGQLIILDVPNETIKPIIDVTTALLDDRGNKFSPTADVVIGVIAITCMVFAIAGNLLAFLYFRRKVKISLPLYLYAIISAIDFGDALLSTPVIDSLLHSRSPRIFDNTAICVPWALVYSYFRRMSMIMVMAVGLTRAIATYSPFRNIRTSTVLITIVGYAGLVLIIDVVYFSAGWLKTKYRPNESFCEIYPTTISAKVAVYSVLLQVEFVVPCLIVVVSSIVCTVSLIGPWRTVSKREKGRRRATITIALFSCVFLICNLPVFLLQLNYLLAQFTSISTVDDFKNHVFLGWYAHLLSHFLLSLLNTALNPCLYFLRMPNYRQWLSDIWTDPGILLRQRSNTMVSQRRSSEYSNKSYNISFERYRRSSLVNSGQTSSSQSFSKRDINI